MKYSPWCRSSIWIGRNDRRRTFNLDAESVVQAHKGAISLLYNSDTLVPCRSQSSPAPISLDMSTSNYHTPGGGPPAPDSRTYTPATGIAATFRAVISVRSSLTASFLIRCHNSWATAVTSRRAEWKRQHHSRLWCSCRRCHFPRHCTFVRSTKIPTNTLHPSQRIDRQYILRYHSQY